MDTETTGDGPTDEVMELAVVSLDTEVPGATEWSTLVRPGVPCSLEARAVHHILDHEVDTFWSMTELLDRRGLPELDDLFVAHNAEFDVRLLRQSGVSVAGPVICTYRCARHLYPNAPRYGNQVLRYYLNVENKPGCPDLRAGVAHRALHDAQVTSRILLEMLSLKTPEELVALTQAPILIKTVGFGKHRGMEFKDVPRDYLRWLVGQDFDADTLHTARHYLTR